MKSTMSTTRMYIQEEPETMDILCGSKKRTFVEHPGSQRFVQIIANFQQRYNEATSRSAKTQVIREIAKESLKDGARFLKKDKQRDCWYVVTHRVIYDKIGHALRSNEPRPSKKCHRASTIIRSQEHHPKEEDQIVSSDACSVTSESSCGSDATPYSVWEPEPFQVESLEQSVEDAKALVDAVNYALDISDEARQRMNLPAAAAPVSFDDEEDNEDSSWMDCFVDLLTDS